MLKKFFLMTLVAIPLCLFCAACAPNVANGNAAPVPCLELENDIPAHHVIPLQGIPSHVGSSITVTWSLYKPAPNIQSPTTPVETIQQATMQELLFGPFSSRDAVDHLSGQSTNAPGRGPVLASSKLIVTSGCKVQSFASSIILPQGLKPGYYDLYLTGSLLYTSGSSSTGSEIPIRIES